MVIELWQVPLLVIAGIVVVYYVAHAVVKSEPLKQVKIAVLCMLALIMGALLWGAVSLTGTSTTANIAAIVSMFIEFGALWLAYQAYQETKEPKSGKDGVEKDAGGDPEGSSRVTSEADRCPPAAE